MKNLKNIAAIATFAATMALSANVQAGGNTIPGQTYTVEQCGDLSQSIDAAHQAYQAALASGATGKIKKTLTTYNELNALYNQVCFGVPHTF